MFLLLHIQMIGTVDPQKKNMQINKMQVKKCNTLNDLTSESKHLKNVKNAHSKANTVQTNQMLHPCCK